MAQRDYTQLIEEKFGVPGAYWEGDSYFTLSPLREDTEISTAFSITREGLWKDFVLDRPGGHIRELLILKGIDEKQVRDVLRGPIISRPRYDYFDNQGNLVFWIERRDYLNGEKTIHPHYYDKSTNKTINKMPKDLIRLPLYRGHLLKEGPVLIVEGEKCVNFLSPYFHNTVTWQGGTNNVKKADWNILKGREIIIWPDNDEPGLKVINEIRNILPEEKISIIPVEGFGKGEDAFDILKNGYDIHDWIDKAEEIKKESILKSRVDYTLWDEMLFTKTGEAKPLDTLDNFEIMLKYYGFKIEINEMNHRMEVFLPEVGYVVPEESIGHIKTVCVRNDFPKDSISDYIKFIGFKHTYHPVRRWLEESDQTWDGVDRIGEVFSWLKLSEKNSLYKILFKKWLVSCISALYLTPFASQGVLTLQGPQGIGKTRFFSSLFPVGYFQEGVTLNLDKKDDHIKIISKWVSELGELSSTFRKSDIDSLKNFVTSSSDNIRLPYGVSAKDYPRRSVYCASVNEANFLKDMTGERRFWVIPVKDIKPTKIDIHQLWLQVKDIFDKGKEVHYLDFDEQRKLSNMNKQHLDLDPVIEKFLHIFEVDFDLETGECTPEYLEEEYGYSVSYILEKQLFIQNAGNRAKSQLNNFLETHGFEKKYTRSRNKGWRAIKLREEGEF